MKTYDGVKYYKTTFLGLDRWQIHLYDQNKRLIDITYCPNEDYMLGYTVCLNHLGREEV